MGRARGGLLYPTTWLLWAVLTDAASGPPVDAAAADHRPHAGRSLLQQGGGGDGADDSESDDFDPRLIIIGGFPRTDLLNDGYVERRGDGFEVAGEPTFWSRDHSKMTILYYCKPKRRWMLAFESAFEASRDGKSCSYTARSPVDADLSTGAGWEEWLSDERGMSDPILGAGILLATTVRAEEKELRDRFTASKIFNPGDPGLTLMKAWVRRVEEGTQADAEGVQRFWYLDSVGGQDFSKEVLHQEMAGKEPYEANFSTPWVMVNVDSGPNWDRCIKRFYARAVRHQGPNCNNCWAHAAVTVADFELCRASKGAWRGPASWLSVGFLTACAEEAIWCEDGCRCGGDMKKALQFMGTHGLPTGGWGDSKTTCVPDFASGRRGVEAMKKSVELNGEVLIVPPKCPKNCTNPDYPRSLRDDLVRLDALKYSWTAFSFETATLVIKEQGTVMINFPVYDDFLHYRYGIYRPGPSSKKLYDHVAVAIGFGEDFVVAVNSWGVYWGKAGSFRMHKDVISTYVVAGYPKVYGRGGVLPFPLPKVPEVHYVWTEGFSYKWLNDAYMKEEESIVNGKYTLRNEMYTYVMYWCERKRAWAITEPGNLPDIKESGQCFWHALQDADSCGGKLMHRVHGCRWLEWDETAECLTECEKCGVGHVADDDGFISHEDL